MKTKITLVLACVLALNSAEASEKSVSSLQDNLVATRNHYSQLIAGDAPNIAVLTLFTNMLPKGGDLHHHSGGCWQMDSLYQVATPKPRG